MKNIHILPTDKPSRLIFNSFHKSFCYQKEIDGMYINDGKVSGADFWGLQKALNNGFKPQNIYITSDEEIKEGDWFYDLDTKYVKVKQSWENSHLGFNGKKIILTTDQDLIQDGVQAIDDEFLEWFVKNPNCDEVEIHIVKLCTNCGQQHCDNRDCRGYKDEPQYLISYSKNTTQRIITYCDGYEVNIEKIIIPKEEPKQETVGKEFYESADKVITVSKQETLEETALRLYPRLINDPYNPMEDDNEEDRNNWIKGAKWMQERMYSEEDMAESFMACWKANVPEGFECKLSFKEWFEQFKNK